MYYTFDSRIRYSEIDHHRTITLPGIINYFQDCSTFQSEDIGYGVERFQTEGKAWVLSYWQVVVERYPKIGERVKVSTWATSFKGILAERNFQMVDESGQAVAYANSVWTFMDKQKGLARLSRDRMRLMHMGWKRRLRCIMSHARFVCRKR